MSFPIRKNLKGRRAVVIGGRVGGVAAAISLAVRGARVVVLERDSSILSDLRPREAEGYRFDPWPPLLVTPQIFAELFASADERLTDFATLERTEHLGRIIFSRERFLDLTPQRDKVIEQVVTLFDADEAARLARILSASDRFYNASSEGRRRPSHRYTMPILGMLNLRQRRAPLVALRRYLRHKELINALASLHPLTGLHLGAPPASSLGQIAELLRDGGWRVEGGGGALRQALLRLCDILGIRFMRNARVDQIELQGGRVRRVCGPSFKPIAASIVVATLPRVTLLRELLPPSEELSQVARRLPPDNSGPDRFRADLAVEGDFPTLAGLNLFPALAPQGEVKALERWQIPPVAPAFAVSRSTAGDSAAPAGHAAISLVSAMPRRSARFRWTESVAEQELMSMVRRMEQGGCRGLGEAIVHRWLRVPAREEIPPWPFTWKERVQRLFLPFSADQVRLTPYPGLYTADPTPGVPHTPANVALAGMLAAVSASQDA